jgi:hypothetical protein
VGHAERHRRVLSRHHEHRGFPDFRAGGGARTVAAMLDLPARTIPFLAAGARAPRRERPKR